MKEHTFNLVIKKLQHQRDLESQLQKYLSVIDLTESYIIVIKALFLDIYPIHKVDIIDWFLYEYRPNLMLISDGKTGKVIYDLDKEGHLWAYLSDLPAPNKKT